MHVLTPSLLALGKSGEILALSLIQVDIYRKTSLLIVLIDPFKIIKNTLYIYKYISGTMQCQKDQQRRFSVNVDLT